jgi:hypothetical protein
LILLVLGVVAVAISTFTHFTTQRVATVDFFEIDVWRPHTIVSLSHEQAGDLTERHALAECLLPDRTAVEATC